MERPLADPWAVQAAYDAIAEDWVRTRRAPWTPVRDFLRGLPRGIRVVDVGAGSARYQALEEAASIQWTLLDVSRRQLEMARTAAARGTHFLHADARALPLRGATADAALIVAVLHHLPTADDRVAALRELRRALKPGSPAIASVWSVAAAEHRKARPAPGAGARDVLIAYSPPLAQPVDRFFHLYEAGELGREFEAAGFRSVQEWLDEENHFVRAVA